MGDPFKVDPLSFIRAMSQALELSSQGISRHHSRTAMISRAIGTVVGLPAADLGILVHAAMFHDIGAAANWDEKHFLIHTAGPGRRVFLHAEKGYRILDGSPALRPLAETVRYHHDLYYGGNPSGLSGQDIPLSSRILHLADRIEVQIDPSVHILFQRDRLIQAVRDMGAFDPDLLVAFEGLRDREAFWLDLVNVEYEREFLSELDLFGRFQPTTDDLIGIADVFAGIVDATSPYTAAHSRNVARVGERLAALEGFSPEEARRYFLAGLLHDIGKLAVPNDLLEKPAKLDADEMEIVKQHPYYSYRILKQVDGFGEIARWVGGHHDTPDGRGYPFHPDKGEISLGSRIIAAADVFSALIENRPYRAGHELPEVFSIMEDMVERRHLDGRLVEDMKREGVRFLSLVDRTVTEQDRNLRKE